MPLNVYLRGGTWHYRGTVAGRRLRGTTGTASKELAQRIASEREARAWKAHLDGPAAVLTFAQAALLYRAARKPTRFLDKVEDYWKDTVVRGIAAGAIRRSAIELYPDAGPATLNRQVIVPTQAIINHAAEQELCSPIRVKRFPVTKKEKEPATWAWVQAFMAAAHKPNLAALACFLFLTGARISEAMAVTWDDVDLANRRVLIRQTKIGNERWAHLPAGLVIALANIPGERRGSVFGFKSRTTSKTQWWGAVRRAGIKRLSYHALRHGFATAALQAGIDPITVARLGGWKSPQHVFTTYGHAAQDDTLTDRLADTPVTHMDGPRARTSARTMD